MCGTSHPEHGDLAGADGGARGATLATAWAAPDVRAIVCVRGGYGAHRMSDCMGWPALRSAKPTVLLGYSDVTALQEAVAARLGVVTLHGPMSGTRLVRRLGGGAAALAHDTLRARVRSGACHRHRRAHWWAGRAVGVTTGGCLSVLSMSVATPTAPRRRAAGSCCSRMSTRRPTESTPTSLICAGRARSTVQPGSCSGRGQTVSRPSPWWPTFSGGLGVPILADLGFGHGDDPITVPLGVLAELDADAGKLVLDQPALA